LLNPRQIGGEKQMGGVKKKKKGLEGGMGARGVRNSGGRKRKRNQGNG